MTVLSLTGTQFTDLLPLTMAAIEPAQWVIAALAAYLIGAIPCGYLVARVVFKQDIRLVGSGNIGATNVARVLGARWGILVLLLDALKGAGPVLWLPRVLGDSGSSADLSVLCGLTAILGHMFPIWLKFRGGKGVATALGVVTVLGWQASLVALAVFAVVFAVFRIVSLSSICAALAYMLTQLIRLWPVSWGSDHASLAAFSIGIAGLIILRHRANIVRLIQGTEPRFRSHKKD